MKIVVFGSDRRVGALHAGNVVDLHRADQRLPARLEDFIAAGQPALDQAQAVIAKARSEVMIPVERANLRAPWPGRRVAMVGGNYGHHLAGMILNSGRPGPTTAEGAARQARDGGQWGFWKVPDDIAGPHDDVPFPRRCKYFDYEGEAAIIIGKRGKNIPASQIADYVWGVTLVNDWSIRDPATGPARPMSYNLAKNFDGSTSLGPCIVVGELDPANVDVETKVNGQVRQHFNSKAMIFSFGEVLEFLSRDFTFIPGDVISGGTDSGTAADQSKVGADGTKPLDLFLKIGDVVEVASPAIGSLRNKLI